MRSGQAEFIAILGVIIIAVVAIIFATQQPSIPTVINPQQQSLQDSLENLIRSGADDTLRVMGTHGGYAEPPADGVVFLDKTVPYWQENGVVNIPDVEATFEQELEDFVNANKDRFVSGLGGDIEVGEASVDATFLPSQITLQVNLPATLNGNPLPATYNIEILSTMGEIVDFAESFTQKQTEERYLEYFILASMLASPMEDGEHITPFMISLTECGDFIFRGRDDLRPHVEDRVKVTLAHTYLPEKAPVNVGDITPYPKYVVPRLDGKAYNTIDVSFHLPDDFELDHQAFQFSPNPIVAVASPIPLTSICVSDPIYVNYFLNFPVVVRVKDPLTGNVFQFAEELLIKDNTPLVWSDSSNYDQELQEFICDNLLCEGDLQVSTLSGSPVENADVTFMGCSVGDTDQFGRVEAPIHCGAGVLRVIKSGHAIYEEFLGYNNLDPKLVTLPEMLTANIVFHQVNVLDFAETYTANDIDLLPPDRRVILTMKSADGKGYNRLYDSATGQFTAVPAGTYGVLAILTDEDYQQAFGQIEMIHTFDEDLEDVHIYLPTNFQFSQLNTATDAVIAQQKGVEFTNLFEQCGIGPIGGLEVDKDDVLPCERTYSEVQS